MRKNRVKIFRKARKNRIKRQDAFIRGQKDAKKEYDSLLKKQTEFWEKEFLDSKNLSDKQIRSLKHTYSHKEMRYKNSQKGIAKAIGFWSMQTDKLRTLNANTYALMNEYDETVLELMRKAAKIKTLKDKLEVNTQELYNHIQKVIEKEPDLIK